MGSLGRNATNLPAGDPVKVLNLTARGRLNVHEYSKRLTRDGVFTSMDDQRSLANVEQGDVVVSWAHPPASQRTQDSVPIWSTTNGLSTIPTAHMSIDVQDLYTKLLGHFNGNEKMAKEYLCAVVTDNIVFQGVAATDVEYNHSLTHKSPVFARQIFGPVEMRVSEAIIPGQFVVARVGIDPTEYYSATSGFAEGYRGTSFEKRPIEVVPMEMACGASSFVRKLNLYLRDPRLTLVAHDPRIPGTSIGLAPLELTTQMLSMAGVVFATRIMALFHAMEFNETRVVQLLQEQTNFQFMEPEDLAPGLIFLRALKAATLTRERNTFDVAMYWSVTMQNWLLAAFGLVPYPQSQPNWDGATQALHRLLEQPETRLSLLKLRNHLATICVHDQADNEFKFNILNRSSADSDQMEGTSNTTQGIVFNPTKLEGQALIKQASLATDWIATLKHNWLNMRYHVVGRAIETDQAGYSIVLLNG